MRFFVNLNNLVVSNSLFSQQQLESIQHKRGAGIPIEVQFHRDGTPELLAASSALIYGFKKKAIFDSGYLASLQPADWTAATVVTTTGAAAEFYRGTLNTNTVECNAALLDDGNPNNDLPDVDINAEFSWKAPTEANPSKSLTVVGKLVNDVNRGDEATVSAAPAYPLATQIEVYLPDVVGYTGGGATKLDGLSGAGYPVNTQFVVDVGGIRASWKKVAGTNATDVPGGYIRFADYNGSTNAFVMQRTSGI